MEKKHCCWPCVARCCGLPRALARLVLLADGSVGGRGVTTTPARRAACSSAPCCYSRTISSHGTCVWRATLLGGRWRHQPLLRRPPRAAGAANHATYIHRSPAASTATAFTGTTQHAA